MTEQPYRTCTKCGCTSLEMDFPKGKSSYCRECENTYRNALYHLKKHHPYPVDHRCDICGRSEDEIPATFGGRGRGSKGACTKTRPWRLDHCHETGEFRGFLCNTCNIGLGKFRDDPEILLNAIAYLQGHKEKAAL